MTETRESATLRSAGPPAVAQPLERAQLVWRRAVTLGGRGQDDRFKVVLDLLRTARHGPSTMLHALTLGRAQLRATPDDVATQDAVHLLTRSIAWLGKRTDAGEVGTATTTRSAGRAAGRAPARIPARKDVRFPGHPGLPAPG
jgi:hypothetical protein